MNIEDVLTEMGKQMGLADVKLDENGVCRLVFDKKYAVDIEASEDRKMVNIYSVLCVVPAEGKEGFYRRLLEANLFGQETGGAAFAVDNAFEEVLLYKTLHMEKTDYQDFVTEMESFVNHLETWTNRLESGEIGGGAQSEPADEPVGSPEMPGSIPGGFIRA